MFEMVGLILCPANLRYPERAGRYDTGDLRPSEVTAGGQGGLPWTLCGQLSRACHVCRVTERKDIFYSLKCKKLFCF